MDSIPIVFYWTIQKKKTSPWNILNLNLRNFHKFWLIDESVTTFVCQMHPHFKFQVGNINRNFVIYMSIAANKRNQEIRREGTSTFTWQNNQFCRQPTVSKLNFILQPIFSNPFYFQMSILCNVIRRNIKVPHIIKISF